jgi:hypothetical protein
MLSMPAENASRAAPARRLFTNGVTSAAPMPTSLRGVSGAYLIQSGLGKKDLPEEAYGHLKGMAASGIPQFLGSRVPRGADG